MMKHRPGMLPSKRTVIELLVAENVTWAGWYSPANLLRKWDEVQGSFMKGAYVDLPFGNTQKVGYLPDDRAARRR